MFILRYALSVIALVSAAFGAASPAIAANDVGAPRQGQARLVRPAALSSSALPGPLRGQYRWMGYPSQVDGLPTDDLYLRDQVYWGRIEPRDNQFNFSYLDQGLNDARSKGAKFGFRVMAYCPGCWMTYRPDKQNWPDVTPPFVPIQESGAPDWNSEQFLTQWEELMATLGERYADDPALGYVDIGGYGLFGEWWVRPGADGVPGTTETMHRIVNAVSRNFPHTHLLINTMTPVDFTLWALQSNPMIGLRTDNLGAPNMHSMVTVDARLQEVWRTRPFFTEWATTGDPVLGAQQVSTWHISTTSSRSMRLQYADMTSAQRTAFVQAATMAGYRYQVTSVRVPTVIRNGRSYAMSWTWRQQGSAPTYDEWSVRLVLRDRTGAEVWRSTLPIDLRALASGTKKWSTSLRVNALPRGRYTVAYLVEDAAGYSAPMMLANAGRDAHGAYPLGALRVR